MVRWNVIFIYQQLPIHLKTGGMGKTIRIQYSVIQFFFLTLTWMKGLKTRKKGIGYFVMHFLLL